MIFWTIFKKKNCNRHRENWHWIFWQWKSVHEQHGGLRRPQCRPWQVHQSIPFVLIFIFSYLREKQFSSKNNLRITKQRPRLMFWPVFTRNIAINGVILRSLLMSLNIFDYNWIDPLGILILNSKFNYNFREFAKVDLPRPGTEFGGSSFEQSAALYCNFLPNSFKMILFLALSYSWLFPILGSFKEPTRENKNLLKLISFLPLVVYIDFEYF